MHNQDTQTTNREPVGCDDFPSNRAHIGVNAGSDAEQDGDAALPLLKQTVIPCTYTKALKIAEIAVLYSLVLLVLAGAWASIQFGRMNQGASLATESANALVYNLNTQVVKNGAQLEWNLQDSHRLIESLTGTNAQLRHTLLDIRQMADEAKKSSDANIDQISKTTAASTAFLVNLDQNVNGRIMPKLEASLEQFRGGMEQFNTFMRLMPPVATEAHGTLVEVHGIAADGHKVADIYTKKAIEATKPLSLGKRIVKFALSGFFKLIMFQL